MNFPGTFYDPTVTEYLQSPSSNDAGHETNGMSGWFELSCIRAGNPSTTAPPDPIRCLALHPSRELIYAGTASGFVHAHAAENATRIASARPDPASWADGSSACHSDPSVRDLAVVGGSGLHSEDAVLAAVPAGLRVLTRGCAPRAALSGDAVNDACAVALNPRNDSQIAIGGNSSLLAVADWTQERIIRQAQLRGGSQVTCADWLDTPAAGSYAIFGTSTGRVSVCDPTTLHEISAVASCAGPVTSIALHEHLIATCGMSVRGGVAVTENSIKLYDVRHMNQQLSHVLFSAGPVSIAFDLWVSSAITGGEALWALSPQGVLQCLEIGGLQTGQGVIPVSNEIHLDAENDSFTTMVVSPEGLVVCGDTGGFMHQWSASEQARINADSEPLWEDDSFVSPLQHAPISPFAFQALERSEVGATIPLAAFECDKGLLSDHFDWLCSGRGSVRDLFMSTSATAQHVRGGNARQRVHHLKSGTSKGSMRPAFARFPPKILSHILESSNMHDFVAHAKAPASFVRNSSHGHEPAPGSHSVQRCTFGRGWTQKGQFRQAEASKRSTSAASPRGSSAASKYGPALDADNKQASARVLPVESSELLSRSVPSTGRNLAKSASMYMIDSVLHSPKGRSAYVEMDLVAYESVEGFDFSRFNKSGMFCGLENALPNVYVNPVIQALYFTTPFRNAVAHHNCDKDTCISCELKFLFTMLGVGESGDAVEAGNFTKAFMKMANADALGLLDGPSALPLAPRIENFMLYLLEQLHKDAGGTGDTIVSRLMGADVISSGKFTPSGSAWERRSRPFLHSLNYEGMPETFTSLVEQTLHQTLEPTRAFCSATGCFETMSHTRRLNSLPNLLLLGANAKARNYAQWWFGNKANATEADQKSEGDIDSLGELSRLIHAMEISIDEVSGDISVSELNEQEMPVHSLPLLQPNDGMVSCGMSDTVTPYDDVNDELSQAESHDGSAKMDTKAEYSLVFVVVLVTGEGNFSCSTGRNVSQEPNGHLIAYVRVPHSYYRENTQAGSLEECPSTGRSKWWCFNDFVIAPCEDGWMEVGKFCEDWKRPCLFGFVRRDIRQRLAWVEAPPAVNVGDVIGTESCNAAVGLSADEDWLKPGALVGLDCEFVMTEREDCEISGDGKRTLITPARMALARVSVVRGDGNLKNVAMIDDYVEVREPVVDYLTRFSGISDGDLDATRSRHSVRPLKSVYKKLLALVDAGVVFVGHGLKKDLRVLNFTVPPSQVVDTVVLFRDRSKRLLSLRFLVGTLIGSDIQTDTSGGHDSVEDAVSALKLYEVYRKLQERSQVEETVRRLYNYGYAHAWKADPSDPFRVTLNQTTEEQHGSSIPDASN